MTESRYLLPPAAYHRPEWFAAEKEQLFEHTWTFAGVEHDLVEPGDYVTVQVGRAPVVVVRGSDGELRAFHNVCRHRGLPLVDGSGSCGKALVCPYHRWNYGLDGSLRSVPQKEQYPELAHGELGLHPVRCQTWKTLVFVHLDPDAVSLDEWMGAFGSQFENFHPGDLVEVSDQRHEVAANWKLYVENHVDWLHLWYLHDRSLGGYDHRSGERLEFGRHWASFEPFVGSAEDGDDWPLRSIPGLDERDRQNGAHLVFPALTLFTNDNYWMVGQLLPVDVSNFVLRLRVFAPPGSDGPRFEAIVNRVMYEDYSVATAMQRAVASPAFEVGPLTTSYEREIMRFHQHYLEYVDPPT